MSRKTILILIAILLVALGVWFYFSSGTPSGTNSSGTQKSLLSSLFPFGAGTNNQQNIKTQEQGTTNPTEETQSSNTPDKLIQISNRLVAGFIPLVTDTTPIIKHDIGGGPESQITQSIFPTVRFAEKGTGYIYDIDVKGQNEKKISETVIARTAEALFANGGVNVLLRYIKTDNTTIASFLGTVTAPANTNAVGTLTGNFLEENIPTVTTSPDKKNFLFLIPTNTGIAGISMKGDGSGKKQLFTSSFSEWLLDWGTSPMLTSKASSTVPGYAYTVLAGGSLQKVLGNIDGLTTKISPDGKTLLYSVSGGGSLNLHILTLKTGVDTNTGLTTLPEKCTWNTTSTVVYCGVGTAIVSAEYPDSWYKGVTHFTDSFWKIDTTTKTTTEINTGEGNNLDVINPSIDPTSQYLIFINKTNGSLWSLQLN